MGLSQRSLAVIFDWICDCPFDPLLLSSSQSRSRVANSLLYFDTENAFKMLIACRDCQVTPTFGPCHCHRRAGGEVFRADDGEFAQPVDGCCHIKCLKPKWPFSLSYATRLSAAATPEAILGLRVLSEVFNYGVYDQENHRFCFRSRLCLRLLRRARLRWFLQGQERQGRYQDRAHQHR